MKLLPAHCHSASGRLHLSRSFKSWFCFSRLSMRSSSEAICSSAPALSSSMILKTLYKFWISLLHSCGKLLNCRMRDMPQSLMGKHAKNGIREGTTYRQRRSTITIEPASSKTFFKHTSMTKPARITIASKQWNQDLKNLI